MKKYEIRRLGLGSLFKLYLIIGLVIGLIVNVVLLATGYALVDVGRELGTMKELVSLGGGVVACILLAIIYGLAAGATAVIGGLIYNIFAAAVGGITVKLAEKE